MDLKKYIDTHRQPRIDPMLVKSWTYQLLQVARLAKQVIDPQRITLEDFFLNSGDSLLSPTPHPPQVCKKISELFVPNVPNDDVMRIVFVLQIFHSQVALTGT